MPTCLPGVLGALPIVLLALLPLLTPPLLLLLLPWAGGGGGVGLTGPSSISRPSPVWCSRRSRSWSILVGPSLVRRGPKTRPLLLLRCCCCCLFVGAGSGGSGLAAASAAAASARAIAAKMAPPWVDAPGGGTGLAGTEPGNKEEHFI